MKRILGFARRLNNINKFKFSNIKQNEEKLSRQFEKVQKQMEEDFEEDPTIDEVLKEQGFVLNTLKNKNFIELHKKDFNTDVYIHFQPKYEQEQEEQEIQQQQSELTEFMTFIVKENKSLIFECNSIESELIINRVTFCDDFSKFQSNSSIYASVNIYPGPLFNTLDNRVQDHLTKYLNQYMNEDTVSIIQHLQQEKEYEKFIDWLKRLNKFMIL